MRNPPNLFFFFEFHLETQATMSRVQRLSLLRLSLLRSSSSRNKSILPSSVYGASATSAWQFPFLKDGASAKMVSSSMEGSSSFSMGLATVADAKVKPFPRFAPRDVVLYQYEACPFCNKVRAFLDFHDVPYKVVEVNPLNKKEIKWSDYKKVPILVVDGEQLVDSSDIIEKINERILPESPVCDEEELQWCRWVDNHLVHMLSPNIYRSPSEAIESFDYITNNGNFSFTERLMVKYVGAAAMYMVSKKLKKRHNISDERGALYDAVEAWINTLNGRDFLGGSKPNLADLAVFGVLRPIRHLRAGKDMVENTHVGDWYNKMEAAVGESSRIHG